MLDTIIIVVLIILSGGGAFLAPAPWNPYRYMNGALTLGLFILLILHLTGKI